MTQLDELVGLARRQPILIGGLAVGAFGIYRLAGGQFGSSAPAAAAVTPTADASGAPTPVAVGNNSDPFAGDSGTGTLGWSGGIGVTPGDVASAIADAIAGIVTPPDSSPVDTPPPAQLPPPGNPVYGQCGPMPLYVQAPGTRRICLNGSWQDVPIGATLPPPITPPVVIRPPDPTPPASSPATSPAPSPAPKPAWAPIGGTAPSNATGAIRVARGTYRLYRVAGGVIPSTTPFRDVTLDAFVAYTDQRATYQWPAEKSQRILVRILGAGHAGSFISPLQSGVTYYDRP